MARRILSADSVLVPQPQASLRDSVRTEGRAHILQLLNQKWMGLPALTPGQLLFDWAESGALQEEIAFVNHAQAFMDEAAVKIAPSVLRIVLTVKHHLPEPQAQRAYLGEKLALDFRRISELSIVAESYGLLDPAQREQGAREIEHYGWSKALKLAYVRDPEARRDIWGRACGLGHSASYRAVLEEIRRFRERRLIAPPMAEDRVEGLIADAVDRIDTFKRRAAHLQSRDDVLEALHELRRVQRELGQVKRALQDKLLAAEVEGLAAQA